MSGFLMVPAFLGLCLLVMGAFMRRSSTGPRKFREGRVTAIVGGKGFGKSLFCVHELLRHVGRPVRCRECGTKHPGHIASNSGIKLPKAQERLYHHVAKWSDVIQFRVDDDGKRVGFSPLPHGTLLLLDEVHLGWAPALQGQQIPDDAAWFLAQCRKLHIEVIWAAQHEDRAALGLRRQTDEIGVCAPPMFRMRKVRFYEPENVRKQGIKPNWVFRYRVSKKLSAAYNTYELIAPEGSQLPTVPAAATVAPVARQGLGARPLPPRRSAASATRR